MEKEEYAIVLEYLPNGYPLDWKMMPIAQAIGEKTMVLLELVPRRGMSLEVGERAYIGEGKREKIYYILGRLQKEKITESAKKQLEEFITTFVKNKEQDFVNFFNNAGAINKRLHQLELLPGLGKKFMQEILHHREEKPFESFEDIRKRIPSMPHPEKAIEKRIIQELTNIERHNLFTS